jgi:hypothetical protein
VVEYYSLAFLVYLFSAFLFFLLFAHPSFFLYYGRQISHKSCRHSRPNYSKPREGGVRRDPWEPECLWLHNLGRMNALKWPAPSQPSASPTRPVGSDEPSVSRDLGSKNLCSSLLSFHQMQHRLAMNALYNPLVRLTQTLF